MSEKQPSQQARKPAGRQSGQASEPVLGRVFKDAMKSGKCTLGTKEVIGEMKSSKVVVASKSASASSKAQLTAEAAKNKVPLVYVDRTSAQLGKMLGRPFRVSAIGLRVISDNDLRQLVETKQ